MVILRYSREILMTPQRVKLIHKKMFGFLVDTLIQAPNHLSYYARYDSDLEYFWGYQVRHMYIRYFNWNFVGRVSDIQDTGWQSGFEEEKYPENRASNAYYFIPFTWTYRYYIILKQIGIER